MTKWRIIEMADGRWRVEKKGWIFYNTAWFRIKDGTAIEWCSSSPIGYVPKDSDHIFESHKEAREAIIDSVENMKKLRTLKFEIK